MRTLQEKYNAILEGKFSKEQFVVEARMQHPNLITRFNGYNDAVKILKNRGMISENFSEYSNDALSDMIINLSRFEGNEELIQHVKQELEKRKPVQEARLTNKSLTDYRYKPTNEMDKYPYEQILRGIRVELETMGVQGTPTAEEYAKALAKVSKNLAKDSIFYTNQLAGVNPKVDQHDQMVDATAKNTVDTFNGMKKVKDLKEDHTKKPDDKYTVKPCKDKKEPWAVWEGEKRVKGFATKQKAKEYADSQNKKQGLTESVLKEGIKNLIKKALMESDEDIYEMQGPKTDAEYKSELENYLEDNQIYGYTDMLFDILTSPEEEAVADNLADFLDDHQIYGYNRGLLAIFRDYANNNERQYIPDEDEEDDMSHPRGYEEASDEESFEDLFESQDMNIVRNLMTMYETKPSEFERLHKQAQVQATTTQHAPTRVKFKHILSLFDRAKAGALQSLANQDRFEADREGMDENADKFYAPTYITQKYGAAKAKEIEANIEDEGANTWDLFTSLETPKEVDDFIGGFTMDESISLKDLL
jgi:hypothetical protein